MKRSTWMLIWIIVSCIAGAVKFAALWHAKPKHIQLGSSDITTKAGTGTNAGFTIQLGSWSWKCPVCGSNREDWPHSTVFYSNDHYTCEIQVMCSECFSNRTPTQRLPYYRARWEEWKTNEWYLPERDVADFRWMEISNAVMEGK